MVLSKRRQYLHLFLFLLPALVFYSLFFLNPLIQGIGFSFTDWNGIKPEIPLTISEDEFNKIIGKLSSSSKKAYLKKYYEMTGKDYKLKSWIEEEGKDIRQLSAGERSKIKRILKQAGINPIKNIGLENYKRVFTDDLRFFPRYENLYLFKEYDDLPEEIEDFEKLVIKNIDNSRDIEFIRNVYIKSAVDENNYILKYNYSDAERIKKILSGNYYKRSLIKGVVGFTLFFTVFNVIGINLLALILALILDLHLPGKNSLRAIFFIPNVLSLIIVAFLWSFVFRMILPPLTGIDVWLGSRDRAGWALLMVTIWQGCGYMMVIYLAGLQGIPTHILESAKLDGAAGLTKLIKIKFPYIMPAATICLFLSITNSLKTFDVILALTSGGPAYSTTPIVLDIYFNAFTQNQFGYATAKAILLCFIIIFITSIQLTVMKRREVNL